MSRLTKTILVATAAAVIFAGCSGKRITAPSDFNLSMGKWETKTPVTIVKVPSILKKRDDLSHDAPDVKVRLRIRKRIPLGKLKSIGKFPLIVDPEIYGRFVPPVNLKGKLSEVADTLSAIAGCYWSYENGVVILKSEKTVYYDFPALSFEKIATVYGAGEDASNAYDLERVKKDVFDEMETLLRSVLGVTKKKGEVKTTFSYDSVSKNGTSEIAENERGTERKIGDRSNRENSTGDTHEKNRFTSEKHKENLKKENKEGFGSPKTRNVVKRGKNYDPVKESLKMLYSAKDEKTRGNEKLKSTENSLSAQNEIKNLSETKTIREKNSKTISYGKNRKDEKRTDSYEEKTLADIGYEFNPKNERFAIVKNTGTVVVRVNRRIERSVDMAMRSIAERLASSMVIFDVYVVEVNEDRMREISTSLDAIIKNPAGTRKFSVGNGGFGAVVKNVANQAANRVSLNALLNYVTENGKGKIVQEPKILTLPTIPARIKASVDYPYLEPQQISVGGTNPQLAYTIKYVHDGLDLTFVSDVIGDSIFVAMGLRINQYLGKDTVSAGTMGKFDLPRQSPRILNAAFRIKPGDMALIGGIGKKKSIRSVRNENILGVDTSDKEEKSDVLIVAVPRLVKFVEEKSDE